MAPIRIAYFISDHGFGHAGRAAAVMTAVRRLLPAARFELFTTCPRWIFSDSLGDAFGYHPELVDVGVVQRSPLEVDMEATLRALAGWIPFDPATVDRLARTLAERRCRLVVCDISPLGIAAAKAAGLPCVLIENFTWDWLYAPFTAQLRDLERFAETFRAIYATVDLHIQTEPLCRPADGTVRVAPISRRPRTAPDVVRAGLNIPREAKMVLVSMGGIPDRFQFLEQLPTKLDIHLVIPGAAGAAGPHANIVALPVRSAFFHPDLLQAADLLIGKAGYSTIAEAYHVGVPFGFIARTRSPESPALERFIRAYLSCRAISAADYASGRWLKILPELLALPRRRPASANGADAVARLLLEKYC